MEQTQSDLQSIKEQLQARQEANSKFWKPAALGASALFLANFYQPASDLYKTLFDPAYKEVESVALAQQQQRLQQKNLVCAINMKRSMVKAANETTLRYGSCENQDVLVEVYPYKKPAYQHWLTAENLNHGEKRSTSLFSLAALAGAFKPGDAPAPTNGHISPAQIELKTLCQGWQDPANQIKLIRVTDEAGQCYRELINVLSGRVEIREKVPCDTQCQQPADTGSNG